MKIVKSLNKDDSNLSNLSAAIITDSRKTKVETEMMAYVRLTQAVDLTAEKNTGIESLTRFVLMSRVSARRSQGWDGEMNRTRRRYDNDDSKNNTGIIEVINRCKHFHRSLSLAPFSSWQASKRTRHFHNGGEIFMCESVFISIFKWVWLTSGVKSSLLTGWTG